MGLSLKTLEKTRSFYKWELKKEGLTKRRRNEYLRALKFIKKCIEEKKRPRKEKNKHLIVYEKAVFQNKRRGY